MAKTLYVTYTHELVGHARKVCEVAKGLGWVVIDGPFDLAFDQSKRFDVALQSYAFLVLSAYAYDAEPGRSEQELLWDEIRKKGKPAFALLVDPATSWPMPWVEWAQMPDRKAPLENFQAKLKKALFLAFFRDNVESIATPATEQLQRLEAEFSAASQTKLFVVWDFSIAGLPLLLEALKRWPPKGFTIQVPGIGAAAGEIFRDIVLPGIENSDRVLVVTDKPNANVAFEAGLALGFGKRLSLVHFGSTIPEWLNQSLFKGFVVNAIRTLEDLRSGIFNEDSWFTPRLGAPIPDHGSTLFLAPGSFVGAALHEVQVRNFPHWKKPPEAANFNDISPALSEVAQAVWAISVHSEGRDIRDGAENAANAVVAGWFYARAQAFPLDDRLSILRQEEMRIVLDVQVPEAKFQSIDTFSTLLIGVPDRRLPSPLTLDQRDFGTSDMKCRMVKIPRQDGRVLWVGVHPVTNSQYSTFCRVTGYAPPRNIDQTKEAPNLPVNDVSLKDAEEFCRWAGFDLPSPDLWRYLALSGSSGRYWWGDDESAIPLAAWFVGNSDERRHEVCTRRANRWGLYDVFGNVWELAPYEEAAEDPYGRAIRVKKAQGLGGAFSTVASDLLISSKREFTEKDASTGFRCIRWEPK